MWDHGRLDDQHTLPDHPVILRGFRPRIRCDSLDDLLQALGSPTVQGYHRDGGEEWQGMASADLATAFRSGALDMNVVDFTITPEMDPTDVLSVPAIMERGNLLLRDPNWHSYRKSLVITQAGTRTDMHVDACGLAGWMYLFAGRKRWQCWPAAVAPAFYDPAEKRYCDMYSGHACPDDKAAAWRQLPMWQGAIGPGDIFWFPEGWLHRVETDADAYGYGGSTLHAARRGQALASWRFDQAQGYSLDAKLDALCALADTAADTTDTAEAPQAA